ncbi:MAG: 5-carboxymethyl-2-hydroxymuconate Delta-isomerase [Arenicella sp.]
MPHCIIEHSKGLNDIELLQAVYQGALNSGLFSEYDIKTRAIAYECFQTGPEKQHFIHVVVKILSGRSPKQKIMLSSDVLTQLKSLSLSDISLTVEVVDIDKVSYAKQLI